MDFVTHFPRTSRKHDAAWVIVDRYTKSEHFFGCADDLHTRGILQAIHIRDRYVIWSTSVYCIEPGSQVYSSILEEFADCHGDTVEDEYCFSSTD